MRNYTARKWFPRESRKNDISSNWYVRIIDRCTNDSDTAAEMKMHLSAFEKSFTGALRSTVRLKSEGPLHLEKVVYDPLPPSHTYTRRDGFALFMGIILARKSPRPRGEEDR